MSLFEVMRSASEYSDSSSDISSSILILYPNPCFTSFVIDLQMLIAAFCLFITCLSYSNLFLSSIDSTLSSIPKMLLETSFLLLLLSSSFIVK